MITNIIITLYEFILKWKGNLYFFTDSVRCQQE